MVTTRHSPAAGPNARAADGIDATVRPRTSVVRLRSRWDDCDRNGHVNNAAALALVRAAHDLARAPTGVLAEVDVAYRRPIAADAAVTAAVEIGVRKPGSQRWSERYRLFVGGAVAIEADTTWAPRHAPDPVDLTGVPQDDGARSHAMAIRPRMSDRGPDGSVRPQAILQWVEDAVFVAAANSGWDGPRLAALGIHPIIVEHRLLLGPAIRGSGEVVVVSTLVQVRRASATWRHVIREEAGISVAVDVARGAFVDEDGGLAPTPVGLVESLRAPMDRLPMPHEGRRSA